MTIADARRRIRVREVRSDEIPAQRERLLKSVKRTHAELEERERTYELTPEEAAALQRLRGLAFLEGDD